MTEQDRERMPSGSSSVPSRRRAPGVTRALVATAVLLVVGVVALVLGLRNTPASLGPPTPAAAPAVTTASPLTSTSPGGAASLGIPPPRSTRATSAPAGNDIGTFLDASEPSSIEIPSIGVRSTTFVPLHVQGDGTISVPGTAQEVGLYDDGPTPGQLGPAVVAAHVDTPSGVPGVFFELGKVKAGDVVRVSRRDGTHLTFRVDRVAAYPKAQFPTELVYKGDFTKSEIRLVTCGGPTDSRNEYRDNVIVFGHLTSVR